MKKTLSVLAMVLTMALSLVSCEDEEYACRPVYGKIYAIPSTVYPGDTVIIEADVKYHGHRIYKAEYTWNDGAGMKKSVRVLANDDDKTIMENPQLTWVPQTSGSYKFSMSAKLYYSMPDSVGSLYGYASATSTTITVSRRP